MTSGEVVLFDWAYTDGTGSKLRPAVVVQADYLHGILDDTILVQITTTRHGIPGTEVELDPAVETASGLLHLSYVFCPNLLTADPAFIDATIVMLSDQAMRKIDESLKATLAIP
jgi:mRNA-degrading endonuclease toxin of MazEF toxin-antitoxin module